MAQDRIDRRTLELARLRQSFFDEIGGCFARDSQFARGVGEMEEMNFYEQFVINSEGFFYRRDAESAEKKFFNLISLRSLRLCGSIVFSE
jgi:hypothetical protein